MQVKLRPWEKGDEENLVIQADNINIWNNVRDLFPHPYTLKDAEDWIFLNKGIDPPHNLVVDVDGKAAGGISIKPGEDIHRRNAEIGYWIGEPLWGKGIGTKAVKLMVTYAFENFDISRIFASTFQDNIASHRVLEKAGFKLEAILEKAIIKNDIILDEFHYSLLKEQYVAERKSGNS